MRFQVLTAASMKFRIFWDVAPCSHVEVDRRFRSVYCLHHQSDESSVIFTVAPRRYIPEYYNFIFTLLYLPLNSSCSCGLARSAVPGIRKAGVLSTGLQG
jgi:hypothetical protein